MFSAVLRTLLYSDLFDYALTAEEVCRFLIQATGTRAETEATLEAAARAGAVQTQAGYFALPHNTEIFERRTERAHISAQLWPKARRWGQMLAALPFVRLVAVTGALAMHNSISAKDDVDYLIVTVPGRVWLARALCVAVVRAARPFGVELCPNYVLATTALAQSPRNLYIAHELAQMVPLSGLGVYAQMQAANGWVRGFLPNHPFAAPQPFSANGAHPAAQRLTEFFLPAALAAPLENWERTRKQGKFQRAAAHAPAAQLDETHVKGHFNDHGAWVMAEYEMRVRELENLVVA